MTDEPQIDENWIGSSEALLSSRIDEAQSLRYLGGLPDTTFGSSAVLARLAEIRTRLDRVSVIRDEIGRFRTGVRVLFKEANARVDDKWSDRVANTQGANRKTFGEQVEGPRERYARADVFVAGDRMVARQRERVFDAVNDAYSLVDSVAKHLDSVRFDLHAQLRVFGGEHRLERTDAG